MTYQVADLKSGLCDRVLGLSRASLGTSREGDEIFDRIGIVRPRTSRTKRLCVPGVAG
jgi:hypothetical protein